MGDHVVLIVKAWYKLTWGFIHRHLGVILRYLFQGVRDLSIYVVYSFILYKRVQEKKKTSEIAMRYI